MSKVKTNLRLEPTTLGYLHYLLEKGEVTSLYGIIDTLVAAFAEHYAEENDLDIKEVTVEAMEIYHKTRRPQSKKSQKEQFTSAKQSMNRVAINKKKKEFNNDILGGVPITEGSLKGNF